MATIFLGQSLQYWLELQHRFATEIPLSSPDLLEEIVELRGRINFYESRIKDMHSMIRVDGK